MGSELHKLIASTTYVWSWPWLAPRQQLYAYIIHAARARMLVIYVDEHEPMAQGNASSMI